MKRGAVLWRRFFRFGAAGLACSLVVTFASYMGYLEGLEARALDLLLWWRVAHVPEEIVLVTIDEAAFRSLGERQPLSRRYLADVVTALSRSGARVVGLDVELQVATSPAEDGALVRAIQQAEASGRTRVVLAAGPGPMPAALAPLASVARGSPEVPLEDDGRIRRAIVGIRQADGRLFPSFALALAGRLGGLDQATIETSLRGAPELELPLPAWDPRSRAFQVRPFRTEPREPWRINFVGPRGSFPSVPSGAIVGLAGSGDEVAAENPFRGRVVLVGATFRQGRDFFGTPLGPMSGVEIHANILHTLLMRSAIRPAAWTYALVLQGVIGLGAGLLFALLSPAKATAVGLAGALAVSLPASYLAFAQGGYWVDFLLPMAAVIVTGFAVETLEKRRFRHTLGRHVGREVADLVFGEREALVAGTRRVSILFSDLRDFTTISEGMPPEVLREMLNEYFAIMTEAVFRHRGMINDFIGDAVLAIFGAPLADPDHARHALAAGRDMLRGLEEFNRRRAARGHKPLAMGVAIHTGEVFAGNMGTERRGKYTVLGDPVNTASRLEGLNKLLNTTFLISGESHKGLEDLVTVRDHGPIEVKGRTEPIRVYEVLEVRDTPGHTGKDSRGPGVAF